MMGDYVYQVTAKNIESGEKVIYNVMASNVIEAIEYIIREVFFADNNKYTIFAEVNTEYGGLLNASGKGVKEGIELGSINMENLEIFTSSEKEHQVLYKRFGRYVKIGSKFDKFHEANLFMSTLKSSKDIVHYIIGDFSS